MMGFALLHLLPVSVTKIVVGKALYCEPLCLGLLIIDDIAADLLNRSATGLCHPYFYLDIVKHSLFAIYHDSSESEKKSWHRTKQTFRKLYLYKLSRVLCTENLPLYTVFCSHIVNPTVRNHREHIQTPNIEFFLFSCSRKS